MSSLLGMEIEHNKENLAIHLDTYIQETLAEYKAAVTKFLKPKQVPIQPGIMLELEVCPESPDQVRQNLYRSFTAKLQFAATWVRCDIAFPASQLARFCASAGPLHWAALHHVMGYLEANPSFWAALHHVMGYLEANPSFKLTYQIGGSEGLDGFANSYWGNSITRRSTTGLVALYNRGVIMWRSKMQRLCRYQPPRQSTIRPRR